MTWDDEDDTTIYRVVVNHEEQYSIWPADRENARGWKDAGKTGTKAECLQYVKDVWTDMRPLSLRKAMAKEAARAQPASATEPGVTRSPGETAGADVDADDLVSRLSSGTHAVAIQLRPKSTVEALKECLDRGYVPVKFTETRGGTEIGIKIDAERTDLSRADFDAGTGTVHLSGQLTLNSVPLRCIADIDLRNFSGTGHLERVED